MNNRPLFSQDLNNSEKFSKEVLMPLYYSKNPCFKSIEIVDINGHITLEQKMSLQKYGVDTFVTLQNDKVIAIDEKVQFTTEGREWYKRPTQALELAFILTNQEYLIGWFLKKNITSHYLFITYFDTFTNNEPIPNGIYFKNKIIKSIEGILISKEKIFDLLNNFNITKDTIQYNLQQVINNNFNYEKNGKGYIHLYQNQIKIVKTNGLKEQPINLVVKLALYELYSNESFRIYYDIEKANYATINNFRREQYYGIAK